jgi:hypothetical protein
MGEPGRAHIAVYDIAGSMVAELLDTDHAPSSGAILWDCTGKSGGPVSSGTYFIQLRTKNALFTEKLTILR